MAFLWTLLRVTLTLLALRASIHVHAGPSQKKSFDSAFKLKVVEFAEKNSNRGAGRKFGVDEKRVWEWRKQKQQLESLPRKKRGGGRKAALPDMEEELLAILTLHSLLSPVTLYLVLHLRWVLVHAQATHIHDVIHTACHE